MTATERPSGKRLREKVALGVAAAGAILLSYLVVNLLRDEGIGPGSGNRGNPGAAPGTTPGSAADAGSGTKTAAPGRRVEVKGIVVEEADGSPVSEASVQLHEPKAGRLALVSADAQGRFSMSLPSSAIRDSEVAAVRFSARKESREGETFVAPGDLGTVVVIKLLALARLHGTVREPDGRPVVGCRIGMGLSVTYEYDSVPWEHPARDQIHAASREIRGREQAPTREVETDADGNYEVEVRAGTWMMTFSHGSSGLLTGMTIKPGQSRRLDLVFPRPRFAVEGVLVDEQGAPVAGASVFVGGELPSGGVLDGEPFKSKNFCVEGGSCKTDAAGRFSISTPFETVSFGTGYIPGAPKYRLLTSETYTLTADQTVSVKLVLVPRFRISGVLIDDVTGEPARLAPGTTSSGFPVEALRPGTRNDVGIGGRSRNHGEFEVWLDQAGPYDLVIQHAPDLYDPARVEGVMAPSSDVRVVLTRK